MKHRYSVGYCYPSSPNAKKLGVPETGGYYICETSFGEDGWLRNNRLAPGWTKVVAQTRDDPALLAALEDAKQWEDQ